MKILKKGWISLIYPLEMVFMKFLKSDLIQNEMLTKLKYWRSRGKNSPGKSGQTRRPDWGSKWFVQYQSQILKHNFVIHMALL